MAEANNPSESQNDPAPKPFRANRHGRGAAPGGWPAKRRVELTSLLEKKRRERKGLDELDAAIAVLDVEIDEIEREIIRRGGNPHAHPTDAADFARRRGEING